MLLFSNIYNVNTNVNEKKNNDPLHDCHNNTISSIKKYIHYIYLYFRCIVIYFKVEKI